MFIIVSLCSSETEDHMEVIKPNAPDVVVIFSFSINVRVCR